MINQIQNIEKEISDYQINDTADVEKFRIHFLGSKGLIKGLYTLLREVPNEQKKRIWAKNQ
jgi:phenylalanyl-tRNA synthetase alpha chain